MKAKLIEIQSILLKSGHYSGALDGMIGWGSYQAFLSLMDKSVNKTVNTGIKQAVIDIQTILKSVHEYVIVDGLGGRNTISAFNSLLPVPKLTESTIQRIYPKAKSGFIEHLNQYISQYGITTKADLCAFLANVLHESQGFNRLRENVSYSAQRLIQVFPKYVKTLAEAQALVKQGEIAICDAIYGGRLGNGKGSDGYNYRGGGLIHLTGRYNYELASIGIGANKELLNNPQLIATPSFAIKTALWFWRKNQCNGYANQGRFLMCCITVNGGTNGIDDRNRLHQNAWNMIF